MRLPVFSIIQIVRRIVVVWAIEVVALIALASVLPGIELHGWRAAVLGVAAIGLLNALVRPILLIFMMPFTLVTFGFFTLGLNAFMLVLAGRLVPGLEITGVLTSITAAIGLAGINTLLASLLSIGDHHSFYRNVVRRLSRVHLPEDNDIRPGLIMIEIDGLARAHLEEAMRRGFVPTLARWIRDGTHRLQGWDCGLPSQTSSSQAGILHGNNFDIPAFRWYDKDLGRVIASSHPGDTALIESRVSDGNGLLRGGVSVCNMLSGDAELSLATMSTFARDNTPDATRVYYRYFLNPYHFTRALVRSLWEILVEVLEASRDRFAGVHPRASRGGWFPLLRAVATVVQRDVSLYVMASEIFGGVSTAYTTFVGYDVVAHHAGPTRRGALRVLRDIDRKIRELRHAADDAPRPYHFIILSDHGQSPSVPFRHLYGASLEDVVRDALGRTEHVHAPQGSSEGWGHLNALLSDAIGHERLGGRAARRILRHQIRDGAVDVTPLKHGRIQSSDAPPDVVVCASGNLGHIYLVEGTGRIPVENIAVRYPHLIEALVAHPGIDFVMVTSSEHGPIVVGRDGVRHLSGDRVEGVDPLAAYPVDATRHLLRLDSFPHTGDIVVNGHFNAETGSVVTFEDQVGTHGGLGGDQTRPFILYPMAWEATRAEIDSPTKLFEQLTEWRRHVAGESGPAAGRDDR